MLLNQQTVTAILQPLSPVACGEDSRYHDQFVETKREIQKLAGTDYKLVIEHCTQLLSGVSKDARIISYLLLALAQQAGVEGLIQGLELLTALLQRHGSDLHPQRPTAMQAALSWLDQARIVNFIAQSPMIPAQVEQLQQVVKQYEVLVNGRR